MATVSAMLVLSPSHVTLCVPLGPGRALSKLGTGPQVSAGISQGPLRLPVVIPELPTVMTEPGCEGVAVALWPPPWGPSAKPSLTQGPGLVLASLPSKRESPESQEESCHGFQSGPAHHPLACPPRRWRVS